MGVIGAYERYVCATHALKADPNIGLDVLHDVADMEVRVCVGQGSGDEKLARHGLAESWWIVWAMNGPGYGPLNHPMLAVPTALLDHYVLVGTRHGRPGVSQHDSAGRWPFCATWGGELAFVRDEHNRSVVHLYRALKQDPFVPVRVCRWRICPATGCLILRQIADVNPSKSKV